MRHTLRHNTDPEDECSCLWDYSRNPRGTRIPDPNCPWHKGG